AHNRPAFEIGGGSVVIRSSADGHVVCLKLDRMGKEYVHHYVIELDPRPTGHMELLYVDPDEELFDCFATIEMDYGHANGADEAVEAGHAFENKDGHFIKVMDDPKTQKMFGFVEPSSGQVRIRQERKLKGVHKDWTARARIKDEIVELADLLKRFADQL
ncbi:MAG: hypothetical protein HQL36_09630, partial [Alphaproteobacteria bacterium]|nr:hypothetical protein [Alphaproteobacteria bacterium]